MIVLEILCAKKEKMSEQDKFENSSSSMEEDSYEILSDEEIGCNVEANKNESFSSENDEEDPKKIKNPLDLKRFEVLDRLKKKEYSLINVPKDEKATAEYWNDTIFFIADKKIKSSRNGSAAHSVQIGSSIVIVPVERVLSDNM